MRRVLRRISRWFNPRGGPAILMYHRIATPAVDPWGLAVSPGRFAEQVEALRAHRTTLSMDSLVARVESGDLPRNAVALTFDDGYADNLHRAKPVLEAAGVSATVFLTTGLIGSDEEFWWDELARMVLLRAEALSATLILKTERLQIELPAINPKKEPRSGWRGWDPPLTAREGAYQAIWQTLCRCTPECRQSAIEQLRRVFGCPPSDPADLPLSGEDVRKLVSQWISVGAHGRFHQPLTSLSAEARFEEMQKSRTEAAALSALPVTGFAYPHGACDTQTVDMARRAGYRWACSTNETAIDPKRVNVHALPRIAVGDWSGETLLAKLSAVSA